MKPIRLTLKGLNSFIEEQTVDFNKLTDKGLFGIFGPTGSGKSTILDGITLALYGEIVRKSSNLMNMNCNDLSVTFTFQITGASSHLYRVTRNFKRDKKTGKVKTQRAVIEEIKEENNEILAEGVTQVTKTCKKIIGLSLEDFTRTVVLPQGRFSEFLKLEGKDRREMLERLFHLQEYGDELCNKLRIKTNEKKMLLNQIEGEIKGYQGVSEEIRDKEKNYLDELAVHLTTLREKDAKITKEYKKGERIWHLQTELKKYQNLQNDLLSQEKEIEAKEVTVQLGTSVERVKPIVEAYDTTQNAIEQDKNNVQRFTLLKDKIENRKQINEEKFNLVCKEKEEKLMPLNQAKDHINEAMALQQEIQAKEAENKEIEEKLKVVERKLAKLDKDIQKNKQELNQSIETLTIKQNESSNLKVAPIVRQAVSEGIQLTREITFYQDKIKEYKKELDKVMHEQENKPQPQIEVQFQPIIAQLRQTLHEGEPCPVCGSLHHNESEKQIEKIENSIEQLNQKIEPLKQRLQTLQTQLNTEDIVVFNQQLNAKDLKNDTLKEEIEKLTNQREMFRDKEEALKSKRQEWDLSRERGLTNKKSCLKEKQEREQKFEQRMALIYKTLPQSLECKNQEPIESLKRHIEQLIQTIETNYQTLSKEKEQIQQQYEQTTVDLAKASMSLTTHQKRLEVEEKQLTTYLQEENVTLQEVRQFTLTKEKLQTLKQDIERYREQKIALQGSIDTILEQLGNQHINEELWQALEQKYLSIQNDIKLKEKEQTERQLLVKQIEEKLKQLEQLESKQKALDHELAIWTDLDKLFKGKKFVEFVAKQRLQYISLEASKKLMEMSGGIYSLEVDENGKFMICDYKNGGAKRDASTLSGGETFLVSLALALSLSAEIQLKGTAPLELFFLDEGFGTLDEELLEVVMNSLEKLHHDKLKVGIISHIDSIKERVPVKLILKPAIAGEGGTKIKLER